MYTVVIAVWPYRRNNFIIANMSKTGHKLHLIISARTELCIYIKSVCMCVQYSGINIQTNWTKFQNLKRTPLLLFFFIFL